MGKPRRSVATVTKYAEVNSDVDMSEDELKVGQGGIRGAGADSGGDDSDAYGQGEYINILLVTAGRTARVRVGWTREMLARRREETAHSRWIHADDLRSHPPATKTKKKKRRSKGKKGKAKGAFTFEMFVHMPIDVVTEVSAPLLCRPSH